MHFHRVKRREFITLFGCGAVAWPVAARAQPAGKLPTIGFLGSTAPAQQIQWTTAFVQRLRELGWIDGRTVAIEYRWADGRSERFAEFAAEFVRLKVDVILTHNTPPVLAAKQATSVIPIVFATAANPVGTGVVASLARPGGNVTGLSSQSPDVAGKRVELLREVVLGLHRFAIFANPITPMSPLTYVRFRQQRTPLASKKICLKSGEPKTSRPPSRGSRVVRRRSMSCLIRSYFSIGFASTLWHLAHGYRQCTSFESMSKRAV